METFRARPSSLALIMGDLVQGITDKQEETLAIYIKRDNDFKDGVPKVKPLTKIQSDDMNKWLLQKAEPPKLPSTCTSYLKSWYNAKMYGDAREVWTKEIQKGIMMENTAISMVEEVNGLPWTEKNEETFENEWLVGTPDVILPTSIVDTKCPYDSTTFSESINNQLSDLYWWQMQGYMWLCDKQYANVAFCLVNTPAELTSNRKEICYDDIPVKYRYHSKRVDRTDISKLVEDRVTMCREWLQAWHMTQELLLGGNDEDTVI